MFIDLGYDIMVAIYSLLNDEGNPPPVITSDMLRKDPEVWETFLIQKKLSFIPPNNGAP